MKPSQKPLVCVVVLDKQNRRDASNAYQRRFFTRVREAAQACKEKVPAHVGKRARAIVKTSIAMTMRF